MRQCMQGVCSYAHACMLHAQLTIGPDIADMQAHLLVFDVAWMLAVPVHDAAHIWLYHTYTCLCCSLLLDKAAKRCTHLE